MSRISAIGENEVSEYVQEIFTEIENDIEKSDFTGKEQELIIFAKEFQSCHK